MNPTGDPPVLAAVPAAAHPRAARCNTAWSREGCTNHLLTEQPYTAATGRAGTAALCPTPEPSPVPPEHTHGCGGDNLPARARTSRGPHRRAEGRNPDANKELYRWYQMVLDSPRHLAPRARPGLPQLGHCHTPVPHGCMNRYCSALTTAKKFFHLEACFPPPQQPLLL